MVDFVSDAIVFLYRTSCIPLSLTSQPLACPHYPRLLLHPLSRLVLELLKLLLYSRACPWSCTAAKRETLVFCSWFVMVFCVTVVCIMRELCFLGETHKSINRQARCLQPSRGHETDPWATVVIALEDPGVGKGKAREETTLCLM